MFKEPDGEMNIDPSLCSGRLRRISRYARNDTTRHQAETEFAIS